MPHSQFARLQDIVRANAATRREFADVAHRTQRELAETKAATRKAITESRELMAEADALMAKP